MSADDNILNCSKAKIGFRAKVEVGIIVIKIYKRIINFEPVFFRINNAHKNWKWSDSYIIQYKYMHP